MDTLIQNKRNSADGFTMLLHGMALATSWVWLQWWNVDQL